MAPRRSSGRSAPRSPRRERDGARANRSRAAAPHPRASRASPAAARGSALASIARTSSRAPPSPHTHAHTQDVVVVRATSPLERYKCEPPRARKGERPATRQAHPRVVRTDADALDDLASTAHVYVTYDHPASRQTLAVARVLDPGDDRCASDASTVANPPTMSPSTRPKTRPPSVRSSTPRDRGRRRRNPRDPSTSWTSSSPRGSRPSRDPVAFPKPAAPAPARVRGNRAQRRRRRRDACRRAERHPPG